VAIATQQRSMSQYKVEIIFEKQCTRGLLPDQICINQMLGIVVTISLDFLDKYGI
jgi:hypothetical protein